MYKRFIEKIVQLGLGMLVVFSCRDDRDLGHGDSGKLADGTRYVPRMLLDRCVTEDIVGRTYLRALRYTWFTFTSLYVLLTLPLEYAFIVFAPCVFATQSSYDHIFSRCANSSIVIVLTCLLVYTSYFSVMTSGSSRIDIQS